LKLGNNSHFLSTRLQKYRCINQACRLRNFANHRLRTCSYNCGCCCGNNKHMAHWLNNGTYVLAMDI